MDILQPELPSTNNNKSCTFGKGERKAISDIILRNAKEKPAANVYDLKIFDQSLRTPNHGKSFGISWKNYEKAHIPHRKDVYSGIFTASNPAANY